MDYIYGELKNNVPNLEYIGKSTSTAEVVVDETDRSISANVTKLPNSLTINNTSFDGSLPINLSVEENELGYIELFGTTGTLTTEQINQLDKKYCVIKHTLDDDAITDKQYRFYLKGETFANNIYFNNLTEIDSEQQKLVNGIITINTENFSFSFISDDLNIKDSRLPEVSSTDNGKILGVKNNQYELIDAPSGESVYVYYGQLRNNQTYSGLYNSLYNQGTPIELLSVALGVYGYREIDPLGGGAGVEQSRSGLLIFSFAGYGSNGQLIYENREGPMASYTEYSLTLKWTAIIQNDDKVIINRENVLNRVNLSNYQTKDIVVSFTNVVLDSSTNSANLPNISSKWSQLTNTTANVKVSIGLTNGITIVLDRVSSNTHNVEFGGYIAGTFYYANFAESNGNYVGAFGQRDSSVVVNYGDPPTSMTQATNIRTQGGTTYNIVDTDPNTEGGFVKSEYGKMYQDSRLFDQYNSISWLFSYTDNSNNHNQIYIGLFMSDWYSILNSLGEAMGTTITTEYFYNNFVNIYNNSLTESQREGFWKLLVMRAVTKYIYYEEGRMVDTGIIVTNAGIGTANPDAQNYWLAFQTGQLTSLQKSWIGD